jgi:hypothetical protein
VPVSSGDAEEQRLAPPAEDLVASHVTVAPVDTAAQALTETTPALEADLVEESAPATEAADFMADELPIGERADTDLDEEAATAPLPADDTPAPWEAPDQPVAVVPAVKARRPVRQTAPAAPPAPTQAPRPVGGVTLPSRKVAEATPLPAARSRFAAAPAPTSSLRDEEDEDETPASRPRPAPRATPAPARQRAAAPVRRTSRKNRTNMWQTIFYGSMALILAIGTIAGIVTSVGVGTTTGGTTAGNGSATTLLAQADTQLAAGNYSAAIDLYNQVLTATNGSDPKALLGLAKAYYYKTPSEPDIARQYLAQVFTSTGGSTNDPTANEALQLLSTIGLPGSPGAGTPGAGGTPGTTGTPGTGGTSVPATAGTGATGSTPLPATAGTGATGSTPLPPTLGATGQTPLPPTAQATVTVGAAPPAGAPGVGTATPGQ